MVGDIYTDVYPSIFIQYLDAKKWHTNAVKLLGELVQILWSVHLFVPLKVHMAP